VVSLHGLNRAVFIFYAPLSSDCTDVYLSLNWGMWPVSWISADRFLWRKSSTCILEGSRAVFRILFEKQTNKQVKYHEVIWCDISSKIYLGTDRVNTLLTIPSSLRCANTAILLSYAFRGVGINNNNLAKVSKPFTN